MTFISFLGFDLQAPGGLVNAPLVLVDSKLSLEAGWPVLVNVASIDGSLEILNEFLLFADRVVWFEEGGMRRFLVAQVSQQVFEVNRWLQLC